MRDFFIDSFEKLVGVIVILLSIGVVLGAGATMLGGNPGGPNGLLGGLIILIVGAIYIIFVGGIMYLGLGIYQNTKRMADAMERKL